MKRILSFIIVITLALGVLCSCDFLPEEIALCTVEFYVDGELYTSKTVNIGTSVTSPREPSKENQIFVGWYTDGLLSYKFDFSGKILADTKLHASFVLDAVAVTNMLTNQTMKSVVTVKNKCYNTSMGGFIETSASLSQGSGVVLDISGGYCYVLTNYHVIDKNEGYSHQTLTVEDPWGAQYEAKIYKNSRASSSAMDPEYDLALIYFAYSPTESHQLLEIAMGQDAAVGDYVASLGSPGAQKNAITYGKVISYRKLSSDEEALEDEVKFDIAYHSALIDHGSSGGPLVDHLGRLVGLNFAGYESNKYGCAIPFSKIEEFLYTYVYIR